MCDLELWNLTNDDFGSIQASQLSFLGGLLRNQVPALSMATCMDGV